jgi:hypothetical protein
MGYIILDLDNCISDDGWRIPYIYPTLTGFKKYHDYHSLSAFDEIKNTFIIGDNFGSEIIIFTGRPQIYHMITIEWLNRKDIVPFLLFMRPEGNNDNNVKLKYDYLQQLTDDMRGNIVCAYDDNYEVINMYKHHNIPARLIQIHPFEDYGGMNR